MTGCPIAIINRKLSKKVLLIILNTLSHTKSGWRVIELIHNTNLILKVIPHTDLILKMTFEFSSVCVAWHQEPIIGDTKMEGREGFRVGQKRSYRSRFKSFFSTRIITFNVSKLSSDNFSFQWQNSMTDVSVTLRPPCWCPLEGRQMTSSYKAL